MTKTSKTAKPAYNAEAVNKAIATSRKPISRKEGKLMIHEWPGIRIFQDDYDFESTAPPHVVNCPTPVTIDQVVHRANKALKAAGAVE